MNKKWDQIFVSYRNNVIDSSQYLTQSRKNQNSQLTFLETVSSFVTFWKFSFGDDHDTTIFYNEKVIDRNQSTNFTNPLRCLGIDIFPHITFYTVIILLHGIASMFPYKLKV